jgi:hypothetical protein
MMKITGCRTHVVRVGHDAGWRYESLDQAMHPVPPHRAFLAAPRQRMVPEAAHFIAKPPDGPAVARDAVVAAVAAYYRSQPFAHLRDWVVPALPQLGFDLLELGPQATTRCMSMHHKLSLSGPSTASRA